VNSLSAQFQSLSLQRPINKLTPSETCKSDAGNSDFVEVMELLGLARTANLTESNFLSDDNYGLRSEIDAFTIKWGSNNESYGYKPTIDWLIARGLNAFDISNGNGLPNGLLFDVNICTLRGKASNLIQLRYQLMGRTDIVVMPQNRLPGRMKALFFIEIKRVVDLDTESQLKSALRETFLQLLGVNAYNPYCSPPGILTNFFGKHFVLDFSYDEGDDEYKLTIKKCKSFSRAVDLAEEVSNRPSCTINLCRGSSPPPSVNFDNESKATLREYDDNIAYDDEIDSSN